MEKIKSEPSIVVLSKITVTYYSSMGYIKVGQHKMLILPQSRVGYTSEEVTDKLGLEV